MTLDVNTILDGLSSHAAASGMFERVNTHEPKSAPGNGLTAAIWADRLEPYAAHSGLSVTSVRIVFVVRIFSPMLQEPQDAIDPNALTAVATLMTAYSGDFQLSGSVCAVDLLGQSGPGMWAQAGYINQDSKLYRIMDITVPIIVSDVFTQAP